ncbi:hypothetical protein [Gottfriedia solisilvae]|uniref:hypothetical protein n=1 Tax=Gottfriedia solisilvae TaxID=1516104 RepID=UPI003D2F2C2F
MNLPSFVLIVSAGTFTTYFKELNAPVRAVIVRVLPSSLNVASEASPIVTAPVPSTLVKVTTPLFRVPSESSTVVESTALLNLTSI